jgi:alkylation response protein AidB-like acyl-CoA dehydrogenase
MVHPTPIQSADAPALRDLCEQLAARAAEIDRNQRWPEEQLRLCGDYGVYEWFQPVEWGGQGWNAPEVLRSYLLLSAACLTTTFILTQRSGACQRIAGSDNEAVKLRWLFDLAAGRKFATVAISHLTTSRRHLSRPVLEATETSQGFRLDGFSPWVTGGEHADVIVTGATLLDGRQILVALPTDLPGVECPPSPQLVGLTSSHTGEMRCHAVQVDRQWLLAGPVENVMRSGQGAGTGGLQTSALAIGHAGAAIEYLESQARERPDIAPPASELRKEQGALARDLLNAAQGLGQCNQEQLRVRANSLALRASQSALTAAKGMGYVVGHPAGRWCREALFFLVWSCPQPVLAANLCEFAHLD